jgi:hypothetical protein
VLLNNGIFLSESNALFTTPINHVFTKPILSNESIFSRLRAVIRIRSAFFTKSGIFITSFGSRSTLTTTVIKTNVYRVYKLAGIRGILLGQIRIRSIPNGRIRMRLKKNASSALDAKTDPLHLQHFTSY